MSLFNEDNTIEDLLVDSARRAGWRYMEAEDIPRGFHEVLVEPWLMEALLRLNPGLSREQAGIVVLKLRSAIIGTGSADLATANQRFRTLLFEQNTYPFGPDGEHIPIRFFDEDPRQDDCVVTRQLEFPKPSISGGKRFDLVFFVNGIPFAIGETKSPVRPSVSWLDAATDVADYQKSVPEMFVPNAICFGTEGRELRYGGVGAPAAKWGPWFGAGREAGSLDAVERNFFDLFRLGRLLDIYRFYSVFTSDPDTNRKMKVVCRYQQYEGGEAIVRRVLAGRPRKGLIWHFQGSGKSWLMVFAAQKLRVLPQLENPTVVIVDDRIDLEDQITGDFTRAEIPNLASAGSKEELERFFREDQRKVLITTIFKFGDVEGVLSRRKNIVVLVDEAHRTQERDLGRRMRDALPDAFFFGLTGTPINRREQNTFATFGAEEDTNGYLSKYSFQDSIDDGATLELDFSTVPVELHLDEENLKRQFDELTDGLSDDEKSELVRRTTVEAFFTAPERIRKVCEFVARHFRETVEPTGLKAQLVVYNRACCVAYKRELDQLLGPEASTIVMHTDGDKSDLYKEWRRSRDEEKRLLDTFRDPLSPLKIVIVTSKLLTGFDAPILQCMYLDKPMKDHTLLQAICRTNRRYEAKKKCGLVVDFVGVFDDVARALSFDEAEIRTVVRNIREIRDRIPALLQDCLAFFPGVDRRVGGYNGLMAAQQCLPTDEKKDAFAARFALLHKAWETVSPDPELRPLAADYAWLSQVYESVRPVTGGGGSMLWSVLGPKTIELIHGNVTTVDIGSSLDELVLNSAIVDECIANAEKRERRIVEVEKLLRLRLGAHARDPAFRPLLDKLKDLKEKMQQNLMESIDFLRHLLELAKEVLEAEKKVETPEDKRAKARAALTELFESVRSPETPIIVERVVADIDREVVEIVRRYTDAFKTVAGQNEVKKRLRSILWIRYQIKDRDVFEKAYKYIEMYY